MRITLTIAALLLAAGGVASAATPAPKAAPSAATAPQRIDVRKLQPKSIFPKRKLHVELIVEVNKLGQVARVRSIKPSHDDQFDAHAYGNALQAFIRTPDGHVVLGSYRLSYDYDPKTMVVHRDVALVHPGGVNPNAKGAANDMMDIAKRNGSHTPPPSTLGVTPASNPAPVVRRMPDLPQVMTTPSH